MIGDLSVELVTVAVLAGLAIGLALGALGGGGSILAVPVLAYLLGQGAVQATTGSLVVVGTTSAIAAVTAWRDGTALPARGAAFGLVATGGAVAGALASSRVPDAVLMTAFAALVAVVAAAMVVRQVRQSRGSSASGDPDDEPIVRVRPRFVCDCPRALKVVVTATVIGALTGFLGVGGGFLVVPALVLALGLPMRQAVGTSLVVITITSAVALAVRIGHGPAPDWGLVLLLTVAAVTGGWLGSRGARLVSAARLQSAFTALLVAVGAYTAWRAVPALA